MSVSNTGEITKVIIGTADNECLLSGSNWFHAGHASSKGSYPSFVLQPYGDNDAYTAGKNSGLIVSARNPCYRYLQLEISDWRVEDWYRRRVTADNDSLENNYGSYDYLDTLGAQLMTMLLLIQRLFGLGLEVLLIVL